MSTSARPILGLAMFVIAPATDPGSPPSTVVIPELFTSEGCSSCPPADQLLARLAADAARAGDPVATLAFHVTYWNDLGWRDRFSAAAYTKRQEAYARRLELPSLYTPQMVVDGERQFVGSNASEAETAVRAALARTRTIAVTLEAQSDRDSVTARCRVAGAPAGAVLWVAWADAEDASAPDAGENDGIKLRHVHVVRALQRTPIAGGSFAGAVRLERPENVPGAVVAWVQSGDVGAVLAGAMTPVALSAVAADHTPEKTRAGH